MLTSSRLARFLFSALCAATLVCVLGGCGKDEGFNVKGKVTFKGEPIPAGQIYFIPDGKKGNIGSSGYAIIKDGVYDTALPGGKGCSAGAMVVAIEGNDPNASSTDDSSGETLAKTLFPRYEAHVDLPEGTETMDFDVPAEAANRKDKPESPGSGGGGGMIDP